MKTIQQMKFSFTYTYSVYVDTEEYLADSIIADTCLDIIPLKEKEIETRDGKRYILVYMKCKRRNFELFKKFLDVLKYNMFIYGNPSYTKDYEKILEEILSGTQNKVFGGNWSLS